MLELHARCVAVGGLLAVFELFQANIYYHSLGISSRIRQGSWSGKPQALRLDVRGTTGAEQPAMVRTLKEPSVDQLPRSGECISMQTSCVRSLGQL